MSSCPTCHDTFDTDRAVSIHHKLSHGESIAIESQECIHCGEIFEYYPSDKDGKYCSNCAENIVWSGGVSLTGRDNPRYTGGPNKFECDFCGNEFESYKEERTYCSMKCSGEGRSRDMRGDDHWRWKGGRTNYGQSWHKQREKALRRDEHECQICGKEEVEVHHIEPVRSFDDKNKAHTIDNLICLCPKHHRKVEFEKCKIPKDLSDSDT